MEKKYQDVRESNMLLTFWRGRGILHHHFVTADSAVRVKAVTCRLIIKTLVSEEGLAVVDSFSRHSDTSCKWLSLRFYFAYHCMCFIKVITCPSGVPDRCVAEFSPCVTFYVFVWRQQLVPLVSHTGVCHWSFTFHIFCFLLRQKLDPLVSHTGVCHWRFTFHIVRFLLRQQLVLLVSHTVVCHWSSTFNIVCFLIR
jgi:hypothetical protein